MAQITDGLSNTVFMAEILQMENETDYDVRGSIFNNTAGACNFMTKYTPNSGIDTCICRGVNSKTYPGQGNLIRHAASTSHTNRPFPCSGTANSPSCEVLLY